MLACKGPDIICITQITLKGISHWQLFHQECECLKEIFTRLYYPEPLIQNIIRVFIEMKVTGSTHPLEQAGEIPVRIALPFKDQRSANKLHELLSDLSQKINTEVQPVFASRKIKDELKAKEPKPPIVNQQNIVYSFQCDLCDTDMSVLQVNTYINVSRGINDR